MKFSQACLSYISGEEIIHKAGSEPDYLGPSALAFTRQTWNDVEKYDPELLFEKYKQVKPEMCEVFEERPEHWKEDSKAGELYPLLFNRQSWIDVRKAMKEVKANPDILIEKSRQLHLDHPHFFPLETMMCFLEADPNDPDDIIIFRGAVFPRSRSRHSYTRERRLEKLKADFIQRYFYKSEPPDAITEFRDQLINRDVLYRRMIDHTTKAIDGWKEQTKDSKTTVFDDADVSIAPSVDSTKKDLLVKEHIRFLAASCYRIKKRELSKVHAEHSMGESHERTNFCCNPDCCKQEEEVAQFMKCTKCKVTVYCSEDCKRVDWTRHKKDCVFMPICQHCMKMGTKELPFYKCGRCHKASYCCKECQEKDWKQHKVVCKPKKDKDDKKKQQLE